MENVPIMCVKKYIYTYISDIFLFYEKFRKIFVYYCNRKIYMF